ncbi:MAG: T9SS type A sorting domain-containing protein, partial [Bacteroidales bacterium]|nr:T9SS type A sorting domain-containing protein [Bacteroidales bacterium]
NYSIFNVLGQEVANGSSCGTISVADLEKGVYFLQVNGENLQETVKFVVE